MVSGSFPEHMRPQPFSHDVGAMRLPVNPDRRQAKALRVHQFEVDSGLELA